MKKAQTSVQVPGLKYEYECPNDHYNGSREPLDACVVGYCGLPLTRINSRKAR